MMRSSSIVKQATAKSRRAVALVLVGAGLMSGALIAERLLYQADQRAAREQLLAAHSSIGLLIYLGEQQTGSLNMAAQTGDVAWIDRFEEAIPQADAGFEASLALAPPDVARALLEQSEDAGMRSRVLDEDVVAAVRDGNLEQARAILASDDYAAIQAKIGEIGGALSDAVIGAAEGRIKNRDARATATLIGIIAFAFIGGFALWRYIASGLARTETALSTAEETIREMAQTDVLTGLANRRALVDVLTARLPRAKRAHAALSILMIDLDQFKPVNDRFGHVTGDLALKEVAVRLRSVLREDEFAARIGGDEFVVLVEHERGADSAQTVAERIVKRLSQPFEIDNATIRLGASIGVATFPEDSDEPQELLRMADVALYSAKEEGRGRAGAYSRDLDDDLDLRARSKEELRSALASGAIVPYFQPLVSLEDGRIMSFEVLSRWRHPTRGVVPPVDFIPLAEESGLINELTFTVLREACAAARDLPPDMRIAFNISPSQIEDEWLAEKILGVLVETGFNPSQLEIELTETALVNDLAAARRVITSLKNLGVSIALDDFGTGYSSLCYLSELPFDKIKIDRSFVASMNERPESVKIIAAIVGLGESLKVPTVAEGVEHESEATMLRLLGCTAAQGWHFECALPPEQALALVTSRDDHLDRDDEPAAAHG
jgi:diguanylate cyclase (GGDEF)-like protein